jgi:hypothetical protein
LYLLTVLFLTILTSTAHAATIHVPGDQPTIQAGIDAAVDGDTVLVADGTYTGEGNREIDFGGKAIVVMSENGPEVTIIDCEGAGRGFYFHSGEYLSSVVDGFTITNGAGVFPEGGGMYNDGSSPTVKNCTFSGNSPNGMSNNNSIPRVINCTFSGSTYGMYNSGGGPSVDDCTFSGNFVYGMLNNDSSPEVNNCTFSGNLSYGMSNTLGTPEVFDCTFSENTAGGVNNYNSLALFTSCEFSGNSGDGMYSYLGNIEVYDCTFTGNASNGMNNDLSTTELYDCTFTGNASSGMYNNLGLTNVSECTFNENTEGGMYNFQCEATVSNSLFIGNLADNGGGMNNVESNATVKNCLFIGNSADYGGGMHNDYCSPTITNCTFNQNEANVNGAGMACGNGGSPTVTNCILWGDIGSEEIYVNFSDLIVTYSDVEGGYPGLGNIDVPPLFADDECELQSNSPCIDAGDPSILDACRRPGLGKERSDQGAYGGEENCGWPEDLIELIIEPTGPVQIPGGGTLYFNIFIYNNSPNTVSGDLWLDVVLPSSTRILVPPNFLNFPNPLSGQISPNNYMTLPYELNVPELAPIGYYYLKVPAGSFPEVIIDERWLDFEVTD